mmetsp:Transcript_545/g.1486  ORF Transcript_545/g.1486 Transcript_545/m.1486 type:complete len:345 (+) Transcript_545:96-1130(+)
MAWAILLLPVLACVVPALAEPEPEECQLVQTRLRRDGQNDTMPDGPTDGLDALTEEEWGLATLATKLAYRSYGDASEVPKEVGQVLAEINGPQPGTGADFMQARLVKHDNQCWVVFRGTNNDAGWQANGNATQKQTPVTDHNILVADSWVVCYNTVEKGLKQAIQQAYQRQQCSPDNMYITGHSLGAVLANYALVFKLLGQTPPQCLLTLGSPRPWILTSPQCKSLFTDAILPRCSIRLVHFKTTTPQEYDFVTAVPVVVEHQDKQEWSHCADKNIGVYSEADAPNSATFGVADIHDNQPKNLQHADRLLHNPEAYQYIVETDAKLYLQSLTKNRALSWWPHWR